MQQLCKKSWHQSFIVFVPFVLLNRLETKAKVFNFAKLSDRLGDGTDQQTLHNYAKVVKK